MTRTLPTAADDLTGPARRLLRELQETEDGRLTVSDGQRYAAFQVTASGAAWWDPKAHGRLLLSSVHPRPSTGLFGY